MPAAAGFGGVDDVEVVVAGEQGTVLGEAIDGKRGEGGARSRVRLSAVELRDELDPEEGDGLVVAGGLSVLAADGFVVTANACAHVVDGGAFAEGMNGAGAGEDVGGMGPARFGESSGLEGFEEGVDLRFGGGKGVHGQ